MRNILRRFSRRPERPVVESAIGALLDRVGSDKGRWYGRLYDVLLEPVRDSVKCMIEIGIGTMLPTAPSSMVNYGGENYWPTRPGCARRRPAQASERSGKLAAMRPPGQRGVNHTAEVRRESRLQVHKSPRSFVAPRGRRPAFDPGRAGRRWRAGPSHRRWQRGCSAAARSPTPDTRRGKPG